MKVSLFFEHFVSSLEFEVELYDIKEHTSVTLTVSQIKYNDGLREEWKNATVHDWTVYGRKFNLQITK